MRLRSLLTTVLLMLLPACPLARVALAQAPPGLPPAVAQEALGKLPATTYRQVAEWPAAAPLYSHNTGHRVADAAAAGGYAWEALPGRDRAQTHMLFGPYLDEPAGDYVAFFRVERLPGPDEDPLAEFDASNSQGESSENVRLLDGFELPVGRYAEVPLPFHHTGGKLELRVFWKGYVPLRVDRVTLFAVGNLSRDQLLARAPQPEESGLPRNLAPVYEKRPFPELFPLSKPPADTVWTVDLTHTDPAHQLLALSIQGLVNRQQPEVYVFFNSTDQFWLDRMQHQTWIKHVRPLASVGALLNRYRGRLKGQVIFDPRVPATRNLATMIAAVDDLVPASPRLSPTLGLKVVTDLRGRFKTSAEVYRWAFDHLWPRLNHHVTACSSPDQLGLRDYLVENRIFIFWISGPIDGAQPTNDPTAELHLMEQLLARMPVNTPVMSYPYAGPQVGIGEGPGVTLFAEFGKFLVGSTDTTNLSVHSGLRLPALRQKPAPPLPRLQQDRVYVSWVMSDGDNLPVLEENNFPQLWKSPARGKLPVGWSVSPAASLLLPDVVDYFYRTATPADSFLCAVSGVGYTYPDSYGARFTPSARTKVFDGFLDLTRQYMARSDEHEAWLMNITHDEQIARYVDRIPALDGVFPDYGRRVSSYPDATYPTHRDVGVFRAVTGWAEHATREEKIEGLVENIRQITPTERPAFLHLFAWNWGSDLAVMKEVLDRLGPGYVAVRPDQLSALYTGYLHRTQLLLEAPQRVSSIEGKSASFEAVARNVSGRPLAVHLSVNGEARGVSPSRLTLPAGGMLSFRVLCPAGATTARISAAGTFGTRTTTVQVQNVPGDRILGAVALGDDVRFARHYEAEDLGHRVGLRVVDPGASSGAVWRADPAHTDGEWIVYGPYAPLPAGNYLALFRVRRLGPGAGTLATVDTCVGGGTPQTASRPVTADELSPGEFWYVPLLFHHPGGPVETRVRWTGAATLDVDCVDLWQLKAGG